MAPLSKTAAAALGSTSSSDAWRKNGPEVRCRMECQSHSTLNVENVGHVCWMIKC